jgi:hypothetical protein
MPDAPERPIVWIVDDHELSLAIEQDEEPISDEVEQMVELYLGLFFIQIAPTAPQLANVRIAPGASEHRVN